MELRQHIGIFVLIVTSLYVLYLLGMEEVEWWVPLGAAAFIWGIFEAVYWTIKLLIL